MVLFLFHRKMESIDEGREAIAARGKQSKASIRWDSAGKGGLVDAERQAKEMNTEGKEYLMKEQVVDSASLFNDQSKENEVLYQRVNGLRRWLYGLGILGMMFFIGTVVSISLLIKNNKDTVVATMFQLRFTVRRLRALVPWWMRMGLPTIMAQVVEIFTISRDFPFNSL